MFTIKTAEIRWFIKGELPDEIDEWFANTCSNCQQEKGRTDTYLILPDTSEAGVKVRQGRLEIKKQLREPGIVSINDKSEGKKEIWQKWSFSVDNPGNLPVSFNLEPTEWIQINKKRKLSRFAATTNQLTALTDSDLFPENGVNLELTEVKIFDNSWYTLGVESFGNESLIELNLGLLISEFLSDFPFDNLNLSSSMGYPAWIKQNLQ